MQKPDVRYVRLYTDGNAARKIETYSPAPKKRTPRPARRPMLVLHIDPVAIMGIVTAVVMLIIITVSVVKLARVQKELAVMEEYTYQLQKENDALRQEYADGYDIKEVEKTAMALGMIPRQQAQRSVIRLPAEQVQEETGVWTQVRSFLTGLFA